jgi:hypothetical protein
LFAGQLLENRWQGDAEGTAEGIDGRPRSGSEQRPAAVLFDLDLAQVGEVVEDALPFQRLRAVRGETIDQFLSEQQSKKGNEDVAADGGLWKIGRMASKALVVLKASSTAKRLR